MSGTPSSSAPVQHGEAWLYKYHAHAHFRTNMALSEKEKWWLEEQREEILDNLRPRETFRQLLILFPDLFDSQDEDNIFLKSQTPREQSGALLDLLKTRPREALQAFRRVVSTLSPSLGALLWPVSLRLLWLCRSPRHAAMVVHLLKTFASTEFLDTEEGGPCFLVRRSSGGALGDEGALLTLAFPTTPEQFPQMLQEVCAQREKTDLVVLTGSCEALVPGLPAGKAVVPLSSRERDSTVSCRAAERVRHLQTTLQVRLEEGAAWQRDHRKLYSRHTYLDYCSAWLARLCVEVTQTERSAWMERHGVARKRGGGVACRVPEWETGELARHVLRERRSWSVDHASPLGVSPNPSLLSRVSERIASFDGFPSPVEPSPPAGPGFNPLTTVGGEGVSSPNASLFFKTCSAQLPTDCDWLACLAVCHDVFSDSWELAAHTSVTMAMEVVQMLMAISR